MRCDAEVELHHRREGRRQGRATGVGRDASLPTSSFPTPIRPGPIAICCRRPLGGAGAIASSIAPAIRWACSSGISARGGRYEDVAHHTILLGPRYRELLKDIFERKILAEDFSLYLHRPTATDPVARAAGLRHVLRAVARAQSRRRHRTGQRSPSAIASASSSASKRRILPGLASQIVTSRVATPLDFQDRARRLPRRGLRPGADADAERLVPAAQCERGRAQSLSRRRRHASRRRTARRSLVGAHSRQGGARCIRFRLTLGIRRSRRSCRLPRGDPQGSRSFFAASLLLPRACARAGLWALRLLPPRRRRGRRRRRLAAPRWNGCASGSTRAYDGPSACRRRGPRLGGCRAPLRHSARRAGSAARRPRLGRRRAAATRRSTNCTTMPRASPARSA